MNLAMNTDKTPVPPPPAQPAPICPHCGDTGIEFVNGFHAVMERPCPFCSSPDDEDDGEEDDKDARP
jgi:hypothetical protein